MMSMPALPFPGRTPAAWSASVVAAILFATGAHAQGAPLFVELAGGWNYTAPAGTGNYDTHGYSFRASVGREVAPRLRLRFDAFTSEIDHNVQIYPPCAFPGCTHAYYDRFATSITGLTANVLLSPDRDGVFYATVGAGAYDQELQGSTLHLGASAGVGIAVPIHGRLRAVVEARYHAIAGETNGPPWILPVTIGLRY